MIKRYYLGLDNGGTVTKAAILDWEKKAIIALNAVKTEMLFPSPERTEKEVESLWRANLKVIGNVLAATGIDPGEIGGIAVTGHGNGIYLVDEKGRQVRNGIVSTDTRADRYVERAQRDGTFDRVHPRILQTLWGAQPPMLIQWFRENDPKALEETRWFFTIKDLIRFRLTGEAYSELTDLSGESLMNKRDPSELDDYVFEQYGMADLRHKFPPLRNSHDCCGTVTEEAAKLSGLKAGTPVYGGIFDITSCCIASGVVDSSLLSVISGTWSINQFLSREFIEDKSLFMSSIYCIPGWNLITEASPTGASSLEWFVTNIMDRENDDCGCKGTSIYDYCEGLAATVKPDPSILFFPHLYSSNYSDAASGCFIGLKSYHKKADLCRAVYEGIVMSHLFHIERLKSYGMSVGRMRLTGGAARSRMWSQMFADAIGMTVETVEGEEFGIIGTLMSALVGAGCCPDYREAAGALVRVKDVFSPSSELADYFHAKYLRYKKVAELRMTSI